MLLTEDFVYLHMPKTGGGTVRAVLRDLLPAGYVRKGPHPHVHPGWRHIPPAAEGLPVFVHVRNPWDWYVSWYSFANARRERPRTAKLWTSAFGDEPDFTTFVRRACTGGLEHDRPEIANMLRAGIDFYTARWLDLVGGVADERLTIGEFGRLFESLERFMADVGAPVPDGFVARAATAPSVHVSRRRDYRSYYDDDTRRLVERSSSYFVERFGYRF